ncbi:hypothetical protein [Gelidibacter maritimus]|uniref:Uncharacterized protein n=1 Tax=Gelidibacter maritimus TaxID=2761487 RepID=A0A7W2R338_9FLAO|nr:hypothetical protein [Gelidibacter maritimus]MBA6152427.1 hypothetical protein [Gelidibacter maritimus]
MILNTTYTNKKHEALINDLVGKPYSFWQSIMMKGTGSKRMIIDEVSPNMNNYLNSVPDVNYANLEMRPVGILVRINKGLNTYTWVIPYYKLAINKSSNGSSIHAEGKFINFRANSNFRENKGFFDKLLNEKVKYEAEYHTLPSFQ